MKKKLMLVVIILCPVFLSGYKILDRSKYHYLLRLIAEELDTHQIDVIQDWASDVVLEGRPTLAPIADYKVTVLSKESEWEQAFRAKLANAVVAIEGDQPLLAASFIKEWDKTPVEHRVFISFAREDLATAEIIKSVLKKNGFKAFIYLESDGTKFESPEMIAYCMKTAGDVLVLDTENSRTKSGVITEALAYARYSYKTEMNIQAENEQLLQKLKDRITEISFPGAENYTTDNIKDGLRKYYQDMGQDISDKEINDLLKENNQENFTGINTADYIRRTYINSMENKNLTLYARNRMLNENYKMLFNTASLDLFNKTSATGGLIGFYKYFGFCPYYRIPIVLCPICSGGLVR